MSAECPYSRPYGQKDRVRCVLGFYGGSPYTRNCSECMASGFNNKEHAAKLFKTFETSHPAGSKKVSGCCDSAENY